MCVIDPNDHEVLGLLLYCGDSGEQVWSPENSLEFRSVSKPGDNGEWGVSATSIPPGQGS